VTEAEEFIDRIAKAIFPDAWIAAITEIYVDLGASRTVSVTTQLDFLKDEARAKVRLGLAAMREPTRAMVKATEDLCGGYGYGDECFPADPTEIFQAMINEALK
jgi:hypothetical protein